MANSNIDDKFKAFFEERTLSPKENAWDRLETLMPANEQVIKRNRKPIYWLAAAATFIGFVLVLVMWDQNIESLEATIAISNKQNSNGLDFSAVNTEDSIFVNEIKQTENKVKAKFNNQISSVPNPTKEFSENNLGSTNPSMHFSGMDKSDMVLHEVINVKDTSLSNTRPYTKINIDPNLLLQEVNQKLKNKKQTSLAVASTSVRPDPLKLLEEAEIASERSTLQKIFKSLQNNSESVLVAMANRNYQ